MKGFAIISIYKILYDGSIVVDYTNLRNIHKVIDYNQYFLVKGKEDAILEIFKNIVNKKL